MTSTTESAEEAIERLKQGDLTLKVITLETSVKTEDDFECAKLEELVDCLLSCPNVVTHLWLNNNRLPDKIGVKVAHFVRDSATIKVVGLSHNRFGDATHLAMASVLHVNTSLERLYMHECQASSYSRIDCAFISALRLNPRNTESSRWIIHIWNQGDDLPTLKQAAESLGPVSMLEWLRHCDRT